jgi:hypothetical protein
VSINITGTMVAALRAQLLGEHQEHHRLIDTNDLEPEAVFQAELLLLQCLIDYRQLSDDELDMFLRQARDYVTDWSRRYRDRTRNNSE